MSIRKEAIRITAAAGLALTGLTAVMEEVQRPVQAEEKFVVEFYERDLDGDIGEIVRRIEEKGVIVTSPLTWNDGVGEVENLPWTDEEIGILADAMDLLPNNYFNGGSNVKEIILLKYIDRDENLITRGGYRDGILELFIPPDFSIDDIPPVAYGRYFKSKGEMLEFTFIHEWTHGFIEANPDILWKDWVESTDWMQNTRGQWINENRFETFPYAGGQDNPIEDIANGVALMALNSERLNQDRLEFFVNNRYFNGWKPVMEYRQQTSRHPNQGGF